MKVLNGISTVSIQSTRYLVDSLKKNGVDSTIVVYRKNKLLANFEDKSLNIDYNKKYLFPVYSIKIFWFFIKSIFQFNVFHFHFGHSLLPLNIDLFFLKIFRRKVFMEYHGSDIRRKSKCCHPDLLEFCVDDSASLKKQARISKFINGIIVHDNELKGNLFALHVPVYTVPLRINLDNFLFLPPINHSNPLVIVHSPSKTKIKGTKYIIDAIDKLKTKYSIDFRLLTDMPNSLVKINFSEADIVIDQLLIGEYGMVSIEAMAMGKPVICFLNEKYFDETVVLPPIWNANELNIYEKLEELVSNYRLRENLGIKGRGFVEHYHNSDIVAAKMKNIYLNG